MRHGLCILRPVAPECDCVANILGYDKSQFQNVYNCGLRIVTSGIICVIVIFQYLFCTSERVFAVASLQATRVAQLVDSVHIAH